MKNLSSDEAVNKIKALANGVADLDFVPNYAGAYRAYDLWDCNVHVLAKAIVDSFFARGTLLAIVGNNVWGPQDQANHFHDLLLYNGIASDFARNQRYYMCDEEDRNLFELLLVEVIKWSWDVYVIKNDTNFIFISHDGWAVFDSDRPEIIMGRAAEGRYMSEERPWADGPDSAPEPRM